jgi:hypothetical protein
MAMSPDRLAKIERRINEGVFVRADIRECIALLRAMMLSKAAEMDAMRRGIEPRICYDPLGYHSREQWHKLNPEPNMTPPGDNVISTAK